MSLNWGYCPHGSVLQSTWEDFSDYFLDTGSIGMPQTQWPYFLSQILSHLRNKRVRQLRLKNTLLYESCVDTVGNGLYLQVNGLPSSD